MARSRIRGSKSFRRLLKNVEPAVRAEIVHAMQDGGARIAREMQARAPSRTGAIRKALRHRVLPKSLRLQVGLLGRPVNRRLFYANILDKGRKAQVVTAVRKSAAPGVFAVGGARAGRSNRALSTGVPGVYQLRVGPIAPMRFVTGRFKDLRTEMGKQLRGVWDRVLRKASAGAGSD